MYKNQLPLVEDYLRNIISRLIKFGGYSACALFNSDEDLCLIRIKRVEGDRCSIEIKTDDIEYQYCKKWVLLNSDNENGVLNAGSAVFNKDIYVIIMEKSAVDWDDIDISTVIDCIRATNFVEIHEKEYLN